MFIRLYASCVYVYTHTPYTHIAHTHAQEQIREGKNTTKPFNSASAQHLEVLPETFPETPVHMHTNRQGGQEDSSRP